MAKRLLKVGDVILLEAGMKVYARIPEKFVFANVRKSVKLVKTDVEIGEVFRKGKAIYDTHILAGHYVVLETVVGGGGTGMGQHDTYPDGHHVFCQKLKSDLRLDNKGRKLDFYQTGCFTAMIEPDRIQPNREIRYKKVVLPATESMVEVNPL